MIVFHTDLDNTLIYSYKHDIGAQKRCVELYQGREISFITQETYRLLQVLSRRKEQVLIVPTTTRTVEQYQRIDLGVGSFRYALACNGGVLLVNECDCCANERTDICNFAHKKDESWYRDSWEMIREDESWYRDSLEMIQDSVGELHRALASLDRDPRRSFELRFIRDLFVFTKCREPEAVVADLKKTLNVGLVDVFNNGVKVYVVPKTLNKGRAVERFREYAGADYVIAAGDSEFDISMLEAADLGFAPSALAQCYPFSGKVSCLSDEKIFAEAVLEQIFADIHVGSVLSNSISKIL